MFQYKAAISFATEHSLHRQNDAYATVCVHAPYSAHPVPAPAVPKKSQKQQLEEMFAAIVQVRARGQGLRADPLP